MHVRHRKALCRDRFGACFRNSLRCSRYGPCWREKLSETEFYLRYLRGCKVPALRFLCVSICYIARVALNSTRHSALGSLCASLRIRRALSVSISCASRLRRGAACFGNPCVALHAARCRRLKFYVRRPVYRSMSSLGTARLSCFAYATWRRSMVYALAPAPLCVFCRARVT